MEREQKYEGKAGVVVLPPLAGLPGVATVSEPEADTLLAEYFDTDDLRLLKAGGTLRRREGGEDAGWHLKLPDAAGAPGRAPGATSRREIRLSLDRGDRDRLDRQPGHPDRPGDPVPGELASLVRAYTRGAELRPVARIETRRRRTTLHDAAGASLAEVAADEVAAQTLGASTTLSRWNEVEVELTGGDSRLLRAAAKRLHGSGLRPAGYAAKLERALSATLSGAPAALADTAEDLVLGPAKARVTAHFAPRHAAARQAATEALESPRYLALLEELERLLEDPPRTAAAAAPAAKVLPDDVARAYRRVKRRMRRARRTPPGTAQDIAFHQARKAARRGRYAAEALEPAFGKKARRFARRMKAVQSTLGDLHDAVTARAAAREIGVRAHLAGENAFTFGLLLERTQHDALEHQRRARSAWKRAARRGNKLRWS